MWFTLFIGGVLNSKTHIGNSYLSNYEDTIIVVCCCISFVFTVISLVEIGFAFNSFLKRKDKISVHVKKLRIESIERKDFDTYRYWSLKDDELKRRDRLKISKREQKVLIAFNKLVDLYKNKFYNYF